MSEIRKSNVPKAIRYDVRETVTDLLFASSGIEPEIVEAAESIEVLPDLHVQVAQIGHLIALKILSMSEARPQDTADALALVRIADSKAIELARAACQLITGRGYGRDRDLHSGLEALLRRS